MTLRLISYFDGIITVVTRRPLLVLRSSLLRRSSIGCEGRKPCLLVLRSEALLRRVVPAGIYEQACVKPKAGQLRYVSSIYPASSLRDAPYIEFVPASFRSARSQCLMPAVEVRALLPRSSCLGFLISSACLSSRHAHAACRQHSPVCNIDNIHRSSQCAVATNAIFRRSFFPPATRSKCARGTRLAGGTPECRSRRYHVHRLRYLRRSADLLD